ncbi:MAG: hypothetical protein Q9M91_07205 [Candidatus Dojkabacteria bacterium]|nr:hypothetical protein [Candidatus Dojkabacteria bacterium]
MAKLFEYKEKKYKYAYHRGGNTVWLRGQIKDHKFLRISTGKKLSVANMNFVEKNWEKLLQEHWNKKDNKENRAKQLTIAQLVESALEVNETANKGSKKKYRIIFNNHIIPAFGDMLPDDITAGVLRKFQVDLRVKKKLSKKRY